jgi:adenine-specific DNA-methyltransferase
MRFSWPGKHLIKGKIKGEYILENKKSESRLVANKDYVLLRRFSSKDDKSRLIASPYLSKWLSKYDKIGFENHLNYIYRPVGSISPVEAFGLAAILNSRLFDVYFRTFNGNINVSATELRDMPLPDLDIIKTIGKRIIHEERYDQKYIDEIIQAEFRIELN